MGSSKPLTAKQRTVPMPGMEHGPSANGSRPMVDVGSRSLIRVACIVNGQPHTDTHLMERGKILEVLCGAPVRMIDRDGHTGVVCQACRSIASQKRLGYR